MSDNKCEELSTEIRKLFEGSGCILRTTINKKFKIEPYGPDLSFLELSKGKTTFFIDNICANDISKYFSCLLQMIHKTVHFIQKEKLFKVIYIRFIMIPSKN